ncbi:hypothetical protein HY485_00805 [Candidatus Woesearchaeota archaeon]|nr:hypothetical protein [Candidatus Woesearchaeota archaeon]
MSEKESLSRIEQWYAAKLLRIYTPDVEKNFICSALMNTAENFNAFQAFSTAYGVSFGLDELTELYKPNGYLPVLRADFFSRAANDSKLELFIRRASSQDVDCAFVQTYRSPAEFADWVVSTFGNKSFFNDVVFTVLIENPVYDIARLLFGDIESKKPRSFHK